MAQADAERALKNSVFLFVRMAVVLVIGLYTSRVVLRTLGFEDFGIYNVVGSVVLFFTFLNTALTGATSRYLTYELGSGTPDSLQKTYSMAINAHLILAGLMLILLETGGVWFVNHRLNIPEERMIAANWCFQLSVLALVINVATVPFSSCVIAHEHMNYYAVVSIAESLLKLGGVLLLIKFSCDKLIIYSAVILAVTILIRLSYLVYCRHRLGDCRYVRFFDLKLLRQFTSYSGYSLLVSSADGISLQCRNIFFNWFASVLANAAMGLANQVIGVLNGFVDTFTQAVKPQIIKSYASGDRNYFLRLIFSSTKMNYLLFALVSLPVLLNLQFLLDLWLGEYPPYTIPFIQAIVLYMVFDVTQQPLWTAIHATGNIKTHEILMASIKVLVIPVTYLALKWGYSPVLTLYLWAALNMLCAIVRTVYSRFHIELPLRDYLKRVVLPLCMVTLLSLPLPWWLSTVISQPWVKLLVTSAINTLAIICFGYGIGLERSEREFVLRLGPVRRLTAIFKR